jgi:isohexenylglutaconyl-CoA hydratase
VWQRLGDAVARQCLLSGARWSAAQAQAAGLVNTVVADDALGAAVAETERALRAAAPGAVAATKQLLHRLRAKAPDLRTEAAIAFAAALRGPEAAAGLSAFAKKQPAPWVDVPPRSTEGDS